MLQDALKYNDIGWNVIPVDQKRPYFAAWQKERANPEKIRHWFNNKYPDANVGIVTGQISGLVVVDVDSEEGKELVDSYLNGAPATVQTGGGGYHFYFRHPGGFVPNGVRILPGVDIRGENGLVVAPPSVHPNGTTYKWVGGFTGWEDIPDMPQAFLDKIRQDRNEKAKGVTDEDWQRTIGEGERDAELTRRAGKLFRAELPKQEVLNILKGWNSDHCQPSLPEWQVEKIVNSIEKKWGATREEQLGEGKKDPVAAEDYFKVHGFEDALQRYGLQETQWTVEGWVPEATCALVVAPPANYKTWILLDLAISVATGKPFLNQYPVENPGPVLIIQQEDPFAMLFSRIGSIMNIGEPHEKAGEYFLPKPPPMPSIHWHTDRRLNFEDPKSVEGLEKAVEKIRPRMVIIDPLYSAISSKDYMAEGAQNMLELKRLRDEYGTSFIIAHHTVKRGDMSGRESLWGSQFLNAWLETGWQLRPTRNEGTINLKRHFKNVAVPSTLKISFDITDWHFDITTAKTDSLVDAEAGSDDNDFTQQITNQDQFNSKLKIEGRDTMSRVFKKMRKGGPE